MWSKVLCNRGRTERDEWRKIVSTESSTSLAGVDFPIEHFRRLSDEGLPEVTESRDNYTHVRVLQKSDSKDLQIPRETEQGGECSKVKLSLLKEYSQDTAASGHVHSTCTTEHNMATCAEELSATDTRQSVGGASDTSESESETDPSDNNSDDVNTVLSAEMDNEVEDVPEMAPSFSLKQISTPDHAGTESLTATGSQIHIKLVRAKSNSTGQNLDKENRATSDETKATAVDTAKYGITKAQPMYVSNPDVSSKRRGSYFQKVRSMFRSKSTKSLTSISNDSNENLSQVDKTGKTSVQKVASLPFFITTSSDESLSEDLGKSEKKRRQVLSVAEDEINIDMQRDRAGAMSRIAEVQGEGTEEDNEEKGSIKARVTFIDENDALHLMDKHDHVTRPIGFQNGPRLERSYSLLSSEGTSSDAHTVNFTRIPSLRRQREVDIVLYYTFTTILPPDEEDERHVIKEATHVHPFQQGEAMVTDILSNKMVLFTARGEPKITFAFESGSEPWATCLTPDGALAVTLKRQGCVSLWSTSGEPVTEFGQDELTAPTGIACDRKGRFVVTDEQASRVCVFDKNGEFVTEFMDTTNGTVESFSSEGNFLRQPRYVCITKTGNYVISDSANHCVKIFDSAMKFKMAFGGYGRGDGEFKFPYGVASDHEGYLYVADHFNSRVSLFSSNGVFIEHLLTSQDGLMRPKSVAVKKNLLYVTHGHLRSSKVSVFKLIRSPRKSFDIH